jgi:hypothetical protein
MKKGAPYPTFIRHDTLEQFHSAVVCANMYLILDPEWNK